MQHRGVHIEAVAGSSTAAAAGLKPGDVILSMNGHPVRDVIDLMYYRSEEHIHAVFVRDGARHTADITPGEGVELGVTARPFQVRICRNNCVFCFVKQLPKGLRRSLYIKDEDYRLSFLYGNYITLSNITPADRKRIVEQQLSPLYISVHTTSKSLRNRMLGNPKGADVMKELKFFAANRIRMNAQIVLCPGYNDGNELKNTLRDLYSFYPYVQSVAVVPVGLTMHRSQKLAPVTMEDAEKAIKTVAAFQKRLIKRHGDPVIYCADEMYIKAGLPFPPLKDYGSLPQIENGVGMVPLFMSQTKKLKMPRTLPQGKKILTFTGMSFHPFLAKFIQRLTEKDPVPIQLLAVENNFFGSQVTVTGLLTGRDLIRAVRDITETFDFLLVPDAALKEEEDIFLDDVSLKDIEEATGIKTVRIESTPQGLLNAIAAL